MKSGRPSKYESNVKPRFAEIKEWLKAGATDKEIAQNLGINPKVLCKYKNQFNDLNELFKNGRITAVQEIKAALFKRATGFNYTETKVTEDSEGYWKKEVMTLSLHISLTRLVDRKVLVSSQRRKNN